MVLHCNKTTANYTTYLGYIMGQNIIKYSAAATLLGASANA